MHDSIVATNGLRPLQDSIVRQPVRQPIRVLITVRQPVRLLKTKRHPKVF